MYSNTNTPQQGKNSGHDLRRLSGRSVGSTSTLTNLSAEQLISTYDEKKKLGTLDKAQSLKRLVRIALVSHRDNNLAQAADYLEEALTLQPSASEALEMYNQLGVIHCEQGDYTQAQTAYQNALTIAEPTGQTTAHAEARYHLGIAYKGLKAYVEAATYFTQALNLYKLLRQNAPNVIPAIADSHYQLGTVYYAQKHYSDANTQFKDALHIYGEDTDTLEVADLFYHLGLVARAQQDYNQAEEKLNVSLVKYHSLEEDVQEEITLVHYHLGLVNFTLEQLDVALENLQQAIAYSEGNTDHPEAADIWYHLGMIYSQKNQYDQVIANLELAQHAYLEYQNDPAYQLRIGMVNNLLGQAYQAKRAYAIAREFYSQALIAYAPSAEEAGDSAVLAAIHHHLGEVYLAENNRSAATTSFEAAVGMYQRLGQTTKIAPIQALLDQLTAPAPASPSPQRLSASPVVSQPTVTALNTAATGSENSTDSRQSEAEEQESSSSWCCCFFGSSARKKSAEVRKYTDDNTHSPLLVESLTASSTQKGYGSTIS